MASIYTIPFDVLLEVVQYLDFEAVLSLSLTSKAFHAFVDPCTIVPVQAKRDFFLKVERYSQHALPSRLACFSCWRLRPRDSFGDVQATGPRGKWHSHQNRHLAMNRYCWDCGAQKLLYPEQTSIRKGKFLWYLCYQCGEYKLGSQRCRKEKLRNENGTPRYTTICTVRDEPSVSKMEQLPLTVQRQIFAHMDYRTCVMLSQTNKHFHNVVDSQACALRNKSRFLQAQFNVKPESRRSHLMCFGCFTIKPQEKFTGKEERRTSVQRCRRRCKACIYAMHLNSDAARVKLAEWRLRTTCQLCKGLMYRGESEEWDGCCWDCVGQHELYFKRQAVREDRKVARERKTTENEDALDGVRQSWFKEVEVQAAWVQETRVRWAEELQLPTVDMEDRQYARFRNGEMTAAEQSLYTRMQGLVMLRKERQERWHPFHNLLARSAKRLRSLVLGILE